jgi:hypothetical protein
MKRYNKALVCVVTSQNTWRVLEKYCFNSNFSACRKLFDLAVVFNGYDAAGIQYVTTFSPEYLLVRPNFGLDLAAFDYAIKNTHLYASYIFLHDDHWFIDDKWFLHLNDLLQTSDADVLGNLMNSRINMPLNQKIISNVLGYGKYQLENCPFFIQGLAGIYRQKAIECLLELDGIPHIHNNDREAACVCERIHSFLLLDNGIKIGQIPPGYEQYLKHRHYELGNR